MFPGFGHRRKPKIEGAQGIRQGHIAVTGVSGRGSGGIRSFLRDLWKELLGDRCAPEFT